LPRHQALAHGGKSVRQCGVIFRFFGKIPEVGDQTLASILLAYAALAGKDAGTDLFMELFIGIEIGGSKLQVVIGDTQGVIQERRRFTVAKAQGGVGIRAQLQATLPELQRQYPIRAIGVGFGGPVNWRTGKICCSHQIEGWSEFELGQWLTDLTGKPVRVDNDANVGSLGEATRGAGQGFNPSFFMTLGSGVGGGLVADGKIYHGAAPGEVEIGHVRLDRQGTIVEARCSGWAVDAKIRQLKTRGTPSLLCQLIGDATGGEARFLPAALASGDAAAQNILEETAEDLAFGLSHVTHLLHPAVLVLGGGLALVGEPLRAAVARHLPPFLMKAFHPGPLVRLAALGEDAIPVGALVLAAQGTCN
jgi:glucokinase